jgi:hypothetical protein
MECAFGEKNICNLHSDEPRDDNEFGGVAGWRCSRQNGEKLDSGKLVVLSEEGVTREQGEVCVLPLHSLVEALVRCSGRTMVGEVGGNGGGGKPSLCAMREWTKR